MLALFMQGVTAHAAHANEAETKRIIEALKPDDSPKLKTRSLRNLQVEQSGAQTETEQRFVSLTIGFKFNSARKRRDTYLLI